MKRPRPNPDDLDIPDFLRRQPGDIAKSSANVLPSSHTTHTKPKPFHVPMGMTEAEYEVTKAHLERAQHKGEYDMANSMKWKIVPYDASGAIIQRGVTSVPAGTEQVQLYAKMAHCYHRCAKGTVKKIIVHDAADGMRWDWEEGRDNPLPPPEKEEAAPASASKGKAKTDGKAKPEKVSGKKKRAPPPRKQGPGVISVVTDMISAKGGASMDEMMKELTKQFPDRDAASMKSTVRTQMGRQKAHKRQDDKRGTVWTK